MRNKIGEKGAGQFIDAMKKGVVGPNGQTGIKQLASGTKVAGQVFQYEVKLLVSVKLAVRLN